MRVRASLKNVVFFEKELEVEVGRAVVRPLNKLGALIRLRAKSRIRRPARKKKAELTKGELVRYQIGQSQALERGQKAQLPFKPSSAGEYPRSHTRMLPNSIYYAFDKSTKSVWVGPIAFQTNPGEATAALEHGGVSRKRFVAARPYMKPSMDQIVESDFLNAFTNCIGKR